MARRTHNDGGRGIGPNPDGVDYPCVDPSEDIQGLFADLWLSVEAVSIKLPLRVFSIRGFDLFFDEGTEDYSIVTDSSDDHYADLVIVDADDAVIFDSMNAAEYTTRPVGDRLRLHQWIDDTAVCVVVQHTAFAEDLGKTFPDGLEPDNGVLDERTWEQMPARLTSLNGATGELDLVAGFNTSIVVADQRITLQSEPGAGTGRFAACNDAELYVQKINGIGPDEYGNVLLVGRDCISVRDSLTEFFFDIETQTSLWPDVLASVANTPAGEDLELYGAGQGRFLWVTSECGPKCKPEDFYNTYLAVRNVTSEAQSIGTSLAAIRDKLAVLAERFAAERDCRQAKMVRANVIPLSADTVDVVFGVCNTQEECLRDVELFIEIVANDLDDSPSEDDCSIEIVANSIFAVSGAGMPGIVDLTQAPGAESPTGPRDAYVYPFDILRRGESGVIRFRAHIPCATSGTSVSIYSWARDAGGFLPLPDIASFGERTVSLPEA